MVNKGAIEAKILIKKGTLLNSSALVADGKHLLTDTWSSIGLIVGLILIYFTNIFFIDYIITIGLGLFIIYTGFQLLKESVFNLLDKADYIKIKHLISILNSNRKPSWIDIHNLRVVKYGSVVHVDCHMTLPWYYTLEEAHREVDALDQLAKVEFDNIIAKVLAVSKNRTDTRIYVRGDKTINYGRVLEIMGLLSGSGFTKVALISEPLKQR